MSSRRSRKARRIGSALAIFVLLVLGAGIYLLQTSRFQTYLRWRITTQLESITGGRVTLASIRYGWLNSTIYVEDLEVHGSEPPHSMPLFASGSLSLHLNLRALLTGRLDVDRASLRHPSVCLTVGPDGKTNIPSRLTPERSIDSFWRLELSHFDVENGAMIVNDARHAWNSHGQDVQLELGYLARRSSYVVQFSSRQVWIDVQGEPEISGNLSLRAELMRDQLDLRQISIATDGAQLRLSGAVRFARGGSADLTFQVTTTAREIRRFLKWPFLEGGNLAANGTAMFSSATGWDVAGALLGDSVSCRFVKAIIGPATVRSQFTITGQRVGFEDLKIVSRGAALDGIASIDRSRQYSFNGRARGFQLRDGVRLIGEPDLPWSGLASGHLEIAGNLARGWRSASGVAKLEIKPAAGAIPLAGHLNVAFAGSKFRFTDSDLHASNSNIRFAGDESNLQVEIESRNLADFVPALRYLKRTTALAALPTLMSDGYAEFKGELRDLLRSPALIGDLALSRFVYRSQPIERLMWTGVLSPSSLDLSSLTLQSGDSKVMGKTSLELFDWSPTAKSALRFQGSFSGIDPAKWLPRNSNFPLTARSLSGILDLAGTLGEPEGHADIIAQGIELWGRHVEKVQARLMLNPGELAITGARLQDGSSVLAVSGGYFHPVQDYTHGRLSLQVDGRTLPLKELSAQPFQNPGMSGVLDVHAAVITDVSASDLRPVSVDGTGALRNLSIESVPVGTLNLTAKTTGQTLNLSLAGEAGGTPLKGGAHLQLTGTYPLEGALQTTGLPLEALEVPLHSIFGFHTAVAGLVTGSFTFRGSALELSALHASLHFEKIELHPRGAASNTGNLALRNRQPFEVELSDGIALARQPIDLQGPDTLLQITGSAGYRAGKPIRAGLNGSVDLKLLRLFDSALDTSGQAYLSANIGGSAGKPSVNGTLTLKNGLLAMVNGSNMLEAVNGTISFHQDQAQIEKLTADLGGGRLSVNGTVGLAHFATPAFKLSAQASDVRLRYGNNISATANGEFRLNGTSTGGLLSGNATVSRVVFRANADLANVLSGLAEPLTSPSNEEGLLSGLQLDLFLQSAPDLQLSTSLSRDLQAAVNLRLRGTLNHPIVLGTVSANQGDIRVFGSRYTINRGEVSFTNTAKIDPILDLDLQTEARGIAIDVTVSGTLNKLNVAYSSDPPLLPRDIIALLAVGRTPSSVTNLQSAPVTADTSALQAGANTVLGQAISPGQSRLQKLFGVTNIRIDPFVQGLTNTPQTRLTLEQQISRSITITYITNLAQTSEQIFRLEWSLNRQYSVVAVRDDNGEFGIDIQYKKRFK